VCAELHRRSGGNPLFVKELVMLLAERGTLDGPLPAGVRGTIQARLERLSGRCRRLVASAAVAGREAEYDLLLRVSETDAGSVLEDLAEAARAGVLQPLGAETERWRFAHDLFREAVFESIPAAERVRLHRRIASALEEAHARDLDAVAAALALHWHAVARAERRAEPAVAWSLRAAEAARTRLAFEDAVAHCQRALEVLELCGGSDEDRLPALLALSRSSASAGDPARAMAAAQRAAAIARVSGRVEALARAALAPILHTAVPGEFYDAVRALVEEAAGALEGRSDALRAQVLARLAFVLSWDEASARGVRADPRPVALAREALALAPADGDAQARASVLYSVLYAVWPQLSLEERLALTAEFAELEQRIPPGSHRGESSALRITALLESGDIAGADAEIARQQRRIEALDLGPAARWYLIVHRGMRALLAGQLSAAEQHVAALGAAAQRTGIYDFVRAWAAQMCQLRIDQGRAAEIEPWLRSSVAGERDPGFRAVRAFVLCEVGRRSEARELFERELANRLPDPAMEINAPHTLAVLANVCAEVGDAAAAEALYAKLVPLADRFSVNLGAWVCMGSIHWPLGKLAAVRGDLALAVSHFERALERNLAIGASTYAARARLDLGKMLLERGPGETARARASIGEALDAAREFGMERLALLARDALNQASGVPALPTQGTRKSQR
jgi:tetratricopeptide (TPR) repeat protein